MAYGPPLVCHMNCFYWGGVVFNLLNIVHFQVFGPDSLQNMSGIFVVQLIGGLARDFPGHFFP